MFSPWIDVHDVNGHHWANLWGEIAHLNALRERPHRPWLWLFHEEGVVIKAVLGETVLKAGFPYPDHAGRAALGREHNAGMVVGLEANALARFWAEAEGKLKYGDDFLTFVSHVIGAAANFARVGIDVAPGRIIKALPPRLVMDQVFNILFPNHKSLALYVMDEGQVYASLILSKQKGLLSRISTDDGLGSDGLVGGSPAGARPGGQAWADDIPRLKGVLEKKFGPLWVGFFIERQAVRALALGKLTWDQAIEARVLVRDPWPARFAVLEWLYRMARRS